MNITFVSASHASAVAGFSGRRGAGLSQWVVLESIDQFDGMERLIIVAVGLDAAINSSSDAPPRGAFAAVSGYHEGQHDGSCRE